MKTINLNLLNINFSNNDLYTAYIKNLTGNEKYKYKEQEMIDINILLNHLNLNYSFVDNFYYSSSIQQIGKEFDLIKIDNNNVLNIELKSKFDEIKIKKQLEQNIYYLSFLKQKEKRIYSFCTEHKKFYKLCDDELIEVAIDEVKSFIEKIDNNSEVNINDIFVPSNYLISPLNNTDEFIKNKYFLTVHQERIKKELINIDTHLNKYYLVGGKAGTGKTLLLYDIAKYFSLEKNVGIIHCGTLCDGHINLNKYISNISIISISDCKYLKYYDYDIIFVDESHRIRENSLDYIINYCKENMIPCIMFGDSEQKLSKNEENRDLKNYLIKENIYIESEYNLTNKIRTNHQLCNFINVLFDLNKEKKYTYDNVDIIYVNDYTEAKKMIKLYESRNFTFISYTPSSFINSKIDEFGYQINNTHRVIGQEFDNVVMYIDDNFYYSADKKITGKTHPNPDYLYKKLLFQGLTRTRNKIALIIINNEDFLHQLLEKIN